MKSYRKKESKTQFGLKVKTDPKGPKSSPTFLPAISAMLSEILHYVISEGGNMEGRQMAINAQKKYAVKFSGFLCINLYVSII